MVVAMTTEPLVGREASLARVREVIGRSAAGGRSLLLVSGPAGICKSSLVRAAVGEVDVLGWATCVEAIATPGYWPWSRALEAVAAAVGTDATIRAAGEDAPLFAVIAPAFGTAAPSEGSERDRLLLMDAVNRWLLRVAAERPVVIVLDDLQWADESSLAMLEYVARDPTPAALALIGCARDDELDVSARRRLSKLAMAGTTIELEGLDRTAVEELATSVAGRLSPMQLEVLFRRAGGHPVFTRELALLAREGRDHLLPTAVRDAIDRRLAGLTERTREVLQMAALAGNAIDTDVVVAAGLPRAEVDAAVEAARAAGVVTADDADRPRFSHDLYRETISAAIPLDLRAALHQRIGTILEERAELGLPVHPADVAHHFTAAVSVGEASRAARWALSAASADVEGLAFVEAAGHLQRWRQALASSPEVIDPRVHTTVLLAEADALARAGLTENARERLRIAERLA